MAQTKTVPRAAFLLVGFAFLCKALGEICGYAGLGNKEHERMSTRYEVRRLDYVD
jgi:hypothetical protein